MSMIDVKVAPCADRDKVKRDLGELLRERKCLDVSQDDKLEVTDTAQFIQMMNTTQAILIGLLAAMAMIFLLVGGVGIMNIMLVSSLSAHRKLDSVSRSARASGTFSFSSWSRRSPCAPWRRLLASPSVLREARSWRVLLIGL